MAETAPDDTPTPHGAAPIQPGEEWANALTHAISAVLMLALGGYLILTSIDKSGGLALACTAYVVSAVSTFVFSTLSHAILRQPALTTFRAWDQATIYAMISGTYTPIIYVFASDAVRVPLLIAIWLAASAGFYSKVVMRYRVNAGGAISYLLLGWLPSLWLLDRVPRPLAYSMLLGGVVYSIGVIFLMNDRKMRYLHSVWHLAVLAGAICHYVGILRYVVSAV